MPTALVRVVEPTRLGVENPGAAPVQTASQSSPSRAGELIQSLQREAHAVVASRPSRPSYGEMARDVVAESATWYSIIVLVVIGRLLWATARTIVRGDEASAPSRSSG